MSKSLQNANEIGPMAEQKSSSTEPKDQVQLDYEQGKKFLEGGNLSQAAAAFHNALLGYEEKGDSVGVANSSNQLGHVCLAKDDYVGAEQHYQRAWDLCQDFEDPMSLFALQKKFLEVYRGLKEYDKAIATSFDILEVYHGNNDPRGTVSLLENLAEIYIEAGYTDKAVDTYRTIASIHRNFKHMNIATSFEEKAKQLESGN